MKKILFSFLFITSANAWTPPESYNSTYIEIEDAIFSATIRGHYRSAEKQIKESLVKDILQDKNNLVSNTFNIPAYFRASVEFWFSIYAQYTSDQVVIHDNEDLSIIYNIIDFSELHANQDIHRFSKSKLQSHLALEYTRRLKKILKKMSTLSFSQFNKEEDDILNILKRSHLKIPKSLSLRKKLFLRLANNIRTQTGQRNKIFKGIIRSLPYFSYLENTIEEFKLPKELLAIPFLESSFNTVAESKVAAKGVWQFMPYINNLFMPKITNEIDYRLNPLISSFAAFHLLKENKLILRRWDLAVTAYNSGPKHLKRAIKKLSHLKKREDIGLDYILTHYKHPHIGFASKNFYSEFLALVHVLAYKNLIYPISGANPIFPPLEVETLHIYVSKCRFKPSSLITDLKKNFTNTKLLNLHFKNPKKYYPRGSLFITNAKLPIQKFLDIPRETILNRFPKNYEKSISELKCR